MTNLIAKNRLAAKRKFLRFFPRGFNDEKYIAWERDYKWNAHLAWEEMLNKAVFQKLLSQKKYQEIALRAVRIESKTNLLFSFEKMALRDAVKSPQGAKLFAQGLYDFIYGDEEPRQKFENFINILASLPRKQTRVLTWPLVTVFGFIAKPKQHIFVKPNVTKIAANSYNIDINYRPRPNWETYQSIKKFAALIKKDAATLKPKDFIDLQSFIWTMGSAEYDE